jgi:hypothetical protein
MFHLKRHIAVNSMQEYYKNQFIFILLVVFQ